MGAFSALTRSLAHHCIKNSKPFISSHHYQSFRTLILESASSESERINRFSDSGIIEINLDRPGRKNAIGKDMQRGLQHSLEVINGDSSVKSCDDLYFWPEGVLCWC